MRTAEVSEEPRAPAPRANGGSASADRLAGARTWALLAAVPALVLAAGGGWPTACAALLAGALALVGERLLPGAREPEGVALTPAPRAAFDPRCEQTRTLFEVLGEPALVVGPDGLVAFANPAAAALLRQPACDPTGAPIAEALEPEVAGFARDACAAIADPTRAGREPRVRYPAITCGDRTYDLTAVEATSSRTGRRYGVLLLFVDSTRAFELQHLKDRFLSNVSHELRTPLTNVCAYAEILSTMLPGESCEWPEFVRVIHEESLQLSRLVDAMFDCLALECGEAVFEVDELDGSALVREVVRSFVDAAGARDIDLELVDDGTVPPLLADRRRLRQVVHGLLDNALKFTPLGGRVVVGIAGRDEGFELRVADSGPGVPLDERPRVFDKFHQVPNHLTEKPPGAGLGLAICRAIVVRFGGMIWCEDSALGGACFVVLLPTSGHARLVPIAAGAGSGG